MKTNGSSSDLGSSAGKRAGSVFGVPSLQPTISFNGGFKSYSNRE